MRTRAIDYDGWAEFRGANVRDRDGRSKKVRVVAGPACMHHEQTFIKPCSPLCKCFPRLSLRSREVKILSALSNCCHRSIHFETRNFDGRAESISPLEWPLYNNSIYPYKSPRCPDPHHFMQGMG